MDNPFAEGCERGLEDQKERMHTKRLIEGHGIQNPARRKSQGLVMDKGEGQNHCF